MKRERRKRRTADEYDSLISQAFRVSNATRELDEERVKILHAMLGSYTVYLRRWRGVKDWSPRTDDLLF